MSAQQARAAKRAKAKVRAFMSYYARIRRVAWQAMRKARQTVVPSGEVPTNPGNP